MREIDADTPARRLQQARVGAGFATASEAARAFGWNENTYRSHENGERGLKRSVAEKYAKAFRVGVSQILFGDKDINFIAESAIVGYIGNGGIVKVRDPGEKRYIARLGMMFNDSIFAFEVEENSSLVVFQPGDLLLVWAINTKNSLSYSSYNIIEMDPGETLLRLVQSGSKPGHVHLEFPLLPTLVDVRPRSISIVHAIIPRSQWTKVDAANGTELANPRWPAR